MKKRKFANEEIEFLYLRFAEEAPLLFRVVAAPLIEDRCYWPFSEMKLTHKREIGRHY